MLKHPQNTPSDQSPQTRKVRLVGPVRLVGIVGLVRATASPHYPGGVAS